MPDDAVLSVAVDPSGAERGSQVVRRSLEDISRSASTSMSAVERYNTTLGAGATAADIFQRQTAAMAAQLKVLEETSTANARVVADLGLKFEVIRNAAKSAVSALLEFGKTKFTGDVTAQMDRLANDMSRAMDAGGKGAVAAARASQREIMTIAKAGLADQLELVKQEAMKRVAGAQEEWERVKALHLGARSEIAAQERSAAQQAFSDAKKSASELVATAKASNAAALQEIKSRTDQIITLKQRENAVQAEYERGYDSLTRTQQQADATLSRLLTTEKEHAAQQVAEAQESERLLAVVRRGIQAREANAAAIVAETNAIREQSTVAQQAGHYSVSNAGLVSSTLPALPKAPSSGGREVQQESVDVAALADELDKLVLRYDFASAATARRTEAIDTLRTAQRVGILDDDEKFERLRKLVSGEQQHADALTALKAKYSGASDAERRYATELERVTTILNDASASDADRAAILRNVALAFDPAIAATEKAAAENAKLAASYGQIMASVDPAVAAEQRYQKALGDLRAGAAAAGISMNQLAADEEKLTASISPAALAVKKEEDALRSLIGGLDRTWGAADKLAERQGLLDKAMREGVNGVRLSREEHERYSKVLRDQHEIATRSASSTKLAAHESLNLGYQLQDFVVQVGSGQGIFTPLLQQAPQAVGAVGGLDRAMALLTSRTALTVMGVGALGLAFSVVMGRAITIQGELRQFNALLKATGDQAGMTAEQMRGVTDSMLGGGGSRDEANTVVKNIVATRKRVSAEMAKDIGSLSIDMGVVFGGTTDAGKRLTEWLTTGVKGLRDMAAETGALSLAQYEAARAALEHGDKEKGLGIAIGALKDRFSGLHRESLSPAGQAMEDLSLAYNDLVNAAAEHPVTITLEVVGADLLKSVSAFIKDPMNFQFPTFSRDTEFPTPFGIGNRLKKPNPTLSEGAIIGNVPWEPPAPAGTPIPGRKPTAIGGVPLTEAIAISDATAANDKLLSAMQKVGAERVIATARLQAESAAFNAGKSDKAAELEGLEAARMARAQLVVAVNDTIRATAAEVQGNDLLAQAYGVSGAAVREAAVQQKAIAEAARGSIEPYDAIVTRLRLVDDATRKLQAAQFDATLRKQTEDATRLAAAWTKGADAAHEATLANEALAEARKRGLDPTRDAAEIQGIGQGVLARDIAQRSQQFAQMATEQRRAVDLADAEYGMLGQSNAERAKAVAQLQTANDLRDKGADLTDAGTQAYIRQAGELAKVNSILQESAQTAANITQPIASGLEDVIVGAKGAGDAVKALGEDLKRIAARQLITKPFETEVSGFLTKLMSGGVSVSNDNHPTPANDPGVLDRLVTQVRGGLGSSADNAMWVRMSAGAAALAPGQSAWDKLASLAQPLPMSIKDGGDIASLVRSEARAQGVPEEVAVAVAKIESSFRQYDQQGRVTTSSAGAQGVMQLMPGTAKWLGVDASDTLQNVQGGVRYLAMLGRQFGGDWVKAAGAYNAGPTRMTDWVDRGRALPAETTSYMGEFGKVVKTVGSDVGKFGGQVVTANDATAGVTTAQESALQVQFDAITAGKAQTASVQMLTQDQETLVDSVLGVTKPMGDAAGAATAFGDAATSGADTFLGGLQKMMGGASDFFSDLLGVGGTSSAGGSGKRVLRNADGSTSYAPTVKGAGGSWLDAKVFGQAESARPSADFVGPMPGVDAQGIGGWNPSWGQLLQGVGGIASGAMTATQKGASTGQKIGGGLMAAGGVAAMIPGGQIVGGVMMAAGALLSAVSGAKDRGEKYSISHISLGANGKYALGAYDQDNGGDPTRFNADASKVAKGLNDIMARLNLTAGRGDSFIDTKDKSAEQAALELLKGMRSGVPEISYAIAHETATSLDEMLSHLEFANSFQTQMRALRSSLSDLVTQFQSGVDAGNALGKSLLDFVDNAQSVFKVSAGSKLPGFATGTLSAPSGYAIVGEEGPEVVLLAGGERIWNARESAQMLAGLGGRDDTLIHLRSADELGAVQRALGTSGRVNPATGLLGFDGGTASGSGGENAGHGETSSSTAGRDSAYGGGWGDTGRGSGGALSAIADTVSDLSAAVTDTLASFAGWQASTAAATQEQTAALAGVAGLSMTAVAAGLSAIASEVGPSITGMIEGLTGLTSSNPAVDTSYDAMSARSDGGAAQDVSKTIALLADAIKADPSLSNALVGGMRVGGTGTNSLIGPTVQDIVETQGSAFGVYNGDHQQVLQQLDDAAQQLLTATGTIPDVLQRALNVANEMASHFGVTPSTATQLVREEQARQQADLLQSKFDGVGLVKSRVAELNGIVVALGNNTFSPIGKDFDALAADMRRASQAYVAAGQAVPDGLYGAMQQMLALGAVKKRLLDEVAGVTVETSPEEKAVEQLRGKWSTASTDLVKAFSTVGIVGDELAAKLQEGFGNALKKEQTSYSKSLDTGLRKSKGEEGYDSAVALIDSYKLTLKDVNALWPEGADRAAQAAKVTATLTASMSGLVKSGGITDASLRAIIDDFGGTPDVLSATSSALTDLTTAATETAQTARNSMVQSWRSVLSSSLSATTSLVSQWENLRDTLHNKQLSNLLGNFSPLSGQQKVDEAARQFEALLAVANDNTPTDAESLKAADQLAAVGDAYLQANSDFWANTNPKAFYQVQAGLGSVETVAQRQLSAAQQQLAYLESMDATLKALDSAATEQSRMEQIVATPRGWGAADQVATNMQLALKTSYGGDFGGGGWQAWITQQPESIKAIARQVLTQMGQGWRINGFEAGGIIGAYEGGGLVGNGLWGVDSVVARYAGGGAIALAGGEGVLTASATAAIGGSAMIDHINRTRSLPANDWMAPMVNLAPPSAGGGAVTAALAAQNAELLREMRLLRQEAARAARVQALLTEEGTVVNAQGHGRTANTLKLQRDEARAA